MTSLHLATAVLFLFSSVCQLSFAGFSSWPSIGAIPDARIGTQGAVCNDMLLVVGGWTAGSQVNKDIYAFDLNTSMWRTLENFGETPPLFAFTVAESIGDSFYIYGGQSQTGTPHGEFWKYSFSTSSWTLIPSPVISPGPSMFASSAVAQGRFLLFGGAAVVNGMMKTTGTLWAFDPTIETWTLLSDQGPPRARATIAASDEALYVWSGNIGLPGSRCSEEFWAYFFSNDTWQLISGEDIDDDRRRDAPETFKHSRYDVAPGTYEHNGHDVYEPFVGKRNHRAKRLPLDTFSWSSSWFWSWSFGGSGLASFWSWGSYWTCDPTYYNASDGCDCECGIWDPDCDDPEATVWGCFAGQFCDPTTGMCATPSTSSGEVWTCDIDYYNAQDGCDCECGILDPDCRIIGAQLYGCNSGEFCDVRTATCRSMTSSYNWPSSFFYYSLPWSGSSGWWDTSSVGTSYDPCQFLEWVCNPSYFDAYDGCDCNCGMWDPDCEVPGAELYGCLPNQMCDPATARCAGGTEVPPGPTEMGCAAVYGDSFFVGFGWSSAIGYSNTWSKFHIPTRTWISRPVSGLEFYTAGTEGMACGLHGSKLYMWGGWERSNLKMVDLSQPFETSYFTEVHSEYTIPPGRSYHSAVVVANRMLIFGGENREGLLDDVWEFTFFQDEGLIPDPCVNNSVPVVTRAWRKLTSGGIVARKDHTAVALGERMVVLFGTTRLSSVTDEVWVFALSTNEWQQFEVRSESKPSPRTRAAATLLPNNTILVFGGELEAFGRPTMEMWSGTPAGVQIWWRKVEFTDNSNELYPISVLNAMVVLPSFFSHPVVLVAGGQYDPGNPVTETFIFDPESLEWTQWANYAPPSYYTGHALASVGNKVIHYGGHQYQDLLCIPEFLYANFDDYSWWSQLAPEWPVLEYEVGPSFHHSMVYWGGSLWIFGGMPGVNVDSEMGDAHHLSNVLRYYELDPLCNSSYEGNKASCFDCSPGTVYDPIYKTCMPCPKGTFRGVQSSYCVPCPEGFFGPFYGASTSLLCIPCPAGTYNTYPGGQYCWPCNEYEWCPLGTVLPLMIQDIEMSAPERKQPDIIFSQEARSKRIQNTLIIAGASFCFSIFVIMFVLFLCRRDSVAKPFSYADLFFKNKHRGPIGPMMKRRTALGGMVSIILLLVLMLMLALLLVPYVLDNRIMLRFTSPRLVYMDVGFNGELNVSVLLHGFKGNCSGVNNICPSGIRFSWDAQSQHIGSRLSCVELSETCNIFYHCPSCSLGHSAQLDFAFEADRTWADYLEWQVSADIGYFGKISEVSYAIHPTQGRIFRGTNQPNSVYITAFPTLFIDYTASFNSTGYYVDYVRQRAGQEVSAWEFNYYNGLLVEFHFEQPDSIVMLTIQEKQNIITFLTGILGAFTGMIGGMTFALNQVEGLPLMMQSVKDVAEARKKALQKKRGKVNSEDSEEEGTPAQDPFTQPVCETGNSELALVSNS